MMNRTIISFLLLSLVAGQLIRFSLPGQGGGVLVSDVAVIVVLAASVVTLLRNKFFAEIRTTPPIITVFCFLISLFILWSLFTLVIRIPELDLGSALIAGSYWVRLAAYLLLLPALLVLFRDTALRQFTRRGLVAIIAALVLLGFAQLALFPNLQGEGGWDPHRSRLVSTWLDPNFFGAFLVITFLFILSPSGEGENERGWRRRLVFWFLITASAIALALTQSRSSFVALAGAGLLVSPVLLARSLPLKPPRIIRLLVITSVIVVFAALTGTLLGDRLLGLFTIDPTVSLRAAGLAASWQHIVEPNAWLGVGYNAYQFAAQQAGIIGDFSIHSRAGADNSFLTIWATTGLVGLVLFLLPWIFIAQQLLIQLMSSARNQKSEIRKQSTNHALAAIFSLATLFIHAQFVNSFLYPHLLITLSIILALTLSVIPDPFTDGIRNPGRKTLDPESSSG